MLNKAIYDFEQANPTYFKLNPSLNSLVVGCGSGVSSTLVTYPFDLLRTRLAANSGKKFLSMNKTIKSIWKEEGVRGYFAGIKPTMLSVGATTGLMFWSYELARDISNKYKENIPFIEGICGFLAGATSKGITFPLDTLRKRIQVFSVTHRGKSRGKTINLFTNIIKNEGPLSLYRGFGISVLKTAPTSALSLYVYEYSLNSIRNLENVKEKLAS